MDKNNKNNIIENKFGATSIEYALIAALISIAIVGAVTTLGNTLQSSFNSTAAKVSNSTSSEK